MTPLHAIPPASQPVTVSHTGVLFISTPDLLSVLLTVGMVAVALMLYPGQLRQSIKALYAPLGRFLSRLRCPWLWEGVFAAYTCFVIVLKPITWDNWPQDGDEGYRAQKRRLAYPGHDGAFLT